MQTRRTFLGAAVGGILAVTGVVAASEAVAGVADDRLGFTTVATERRAVALSFDDGPSPRYTSDVLDILAAHGASATFFVVGLAVRSDPDLVRRAAAEGHEVANHTLSHERLDRLDRDSVRAQLEGGAEAIAALGLGPPARPRLVRPPFGFEGAASRAELQAGGWEVARWHGCLERHLRREPGADAPARMAAAARPGDILLAHDGGEPDRRATVTALPGLLIALRSHGLAVTSIGGLQTT